MSGANLPRPCRTASSCPSLPCHDPAPTQPRGDLCHPHPNSVSHSAAQARATLPLHRSPFPPLSADWLSPFAPPPPVAPRSASVGLAPHPRRAASAAVQQNTPRAHPVPAPPAGRLRRQRPPPPAWTHSPSGFPATAILSAASAFPRRRSATSTRTPPHQ